MLTTHFLEDVHHSILGFWLPAHIVRRLPFLRPSQQDGTFDLMTGTEQISLHAIDAATEVMRALQRDVDRVLQQRNSQS